MCLYIIVYGHNTLSIVMGRSKRIVALYYNYFFENVGEVYDYTALHCQLAYGGMGERVGKEAWVLT